MPSSCQRASNCQSPERLLVRGSAGLVDSQRTLALIMPESWPMPGFQSAGLRRMTVDLCVTLPGGPNQPAEAVTTLAQSPNVIDVFRK